MGLQHKLQNESKLIQKIRRDGVTIEDVNILDRKPIKTKVKNGHKIYSTEAYAQDLYNLLTNSNISYHKPELGSTERGTVISIGKDEIVVDVPDYKSYVYIAVKGKDSELLEEVKIGQLIEFITEVTEQPYMVRGSVSAYHNVHINDILKSLTEKQEPLKVSVKEMTPAGYVVVATIEDTETELLMPHLQSGVNKLANPESLVGKEIDVMVIEFSSEINKYIVSRKKYLESLIPQTIKKLYYGEVYRGEVTGTTSFGIFVEFNECLTGMIHRANVHPDYVDLIETIKPGTPVEFYVKEIIRDKIILTQILRETLWDTIKVNQRLRGTVKDTKSFGTLIQLDEETVGLVHTSELEKLANPLNVGDTVKVKVLSANRQQRKIFLTVV